MRYTAGGGIFFHGNVYSILITYLNVSLDEASQTKKIYMIDMIHYQIWIGHKILAENDRAGFLWPGSHRADRKSKYKFKHNYSVELASAYTL